MKRKNINELNKMFPHKFPETCGSEALIFYLKYVVYKEFIQSTPIDILKRKEQKLLDLEKTPVLQQYYPKILYLVDSILEEYIRGYIMKPVHDQAISKEKLNFELKLTALENLKNILTIFRNYGYLYLDIRQPNIKISSKGNPTLLDIDSILQIDNPQLDCIPTDIKKYTANGGKINTNTQIFMFNIFAQDTLKLTQNEVDKTGTRILNELKAYKHDSIVDNEYLHHHIKRR